VSGFGKRSLQNGEALHAAIKETDYENLCLLPADFAYHKLDRLLGALGNPGRVLTSLLGTIGDDFDIVFLDCPAGFSRLVEAVLAAVDAIVAPAIPTVLSIRTLAQLIRQAECSRSRASLAAVFNMVDRRKTLHRRACGLAAEHPEMFLRTEIPYASVVEQMAAFRAPTAVYAAHTPAAAAFAEIWGELRTRIGRTEDRREEPRWAAALEGIESFIARLESAERRSAPIDPADCESFRTDADGTVVHRFDTDQRDLERRGQALELHERQDGFIVLARTVNSDSGAGRAEARIDHSWTVQILAGTMSPLDALERRIGSPRPRVVERVRATADGRQFRRVDTYQSRNVYSGEFTDAQDRNRAIG
jgi:cellulose biosynthesis protein BcsQ